MQQSNSGATRALKAFVPRTFASLDHRTSVHAPQQGLLLLLINEQRLALGEQNSRF